MVAPPIPVPTTEPTNPKPIAPSVAEYPKNTSSGCGDDVVTPSITPVARPINDPRRTLFPS